MEIIKYPNDILRQVCSPIEHITEEIKLLGLDMLQAMHDMGGIGLAAPQIGKSINIIVLDTKRYDGGICEIMINPIIIKSSHKRQEFTEGCLSFERGKFVKTNRPKEIKVKWTNIEGQEKIRKFSGVTSICISHELDHLQGVLFIDHEKV